MQATQTFAEMKLDGNPITGLQKMKREESTGLVSWISVDGNAWIATRIPGPVPGSDKSFHWKATMIPLNQQTPSPATAIAINERFSVVAVGTKTYEIGFCLYLPCCLLTQSVRRLQRRGLCLLNIVHGNGRSPSNRVFAQNGHCQAGRDSCPCIESNELVGMVLRWVCSRGRMGSGRTRRLEHIRTPSF